MNDSGRTHMTQTLKNFMKGMSNVLNLSPNDIHDFPTKNLSQNAGNVERHFAAVEKTLKEVLKNENRKTQ